jgi:predicted flavoprotein YhiN
MAAEVLSGAGVRVTVYDAMPSVGRKFLLAGVGGMNITHSEPQVDFLGRYREREAEMTALLAGFDANRLRDWVHGLGVETFVGSSGKVFPREMKAAPLLRAWLTRLREAGVRFCVRHRWLGWNDQGRCALPRQRARLKPGQMRCCWPWAVAAGKSWARMAAGCLCWLRVAWRCGHCCRPIAVLTATGVHTLPTSMPASRSSR